MGGPMIKGAFSFLLGLVYAAIRLYRHSRAPRPRDQVEARVEEAMMAHAASRNGNLIERVP